MVTLEGDILGESTDDPHTSDSVIVQKEKEDSLSKEQLVSVNSHDGDSSVQNQAGAVQLSDSSTCKVVSGENGDHVDSAIVGSHHADVAGLLMGGGVSVDSLLSEATSTGSHSPSKPGASPVHSVRTPVTENDPLGLFNLGIVPSDSQNSTNAESIANTSMDANTSGYNADSTSRANRTNLLIDIEPFSGTSTPICDRTRQNPFDSPDKKRSPSDGGRSFTSSDSSSPTSPVKPWSPLNKSLSETDTQSKVDESETKTKSATLPANVSRDAMVTPPRRPQPVTRSSSFGNALRSAASRFATKFTELKQNMGTPQKGEMGSNTSLPRAAESQTQKLLSEEEENMFLKKAGSADELGTGDEVDSAALEEAMGMKSRQRQMSRYTPFGEFRGTFD